MKKEGKLYISIFVKSLVVFIVIGILPLIIMGISINRSFSEDVKITLLSNLSQMTRYVGRGVTDLVEEMNENTQYVYQYGITEYDYFYELVTDPAVTLTKKHQMVTDVLRSILYMNQYIDHVMFITPGGMQYTSMRPPEIMVNASAMKSFHEKSKMEDKDFTIIPSHVTDYFVYSPVQDFSVARNIMNTNSVRQAESEVLGTLYIDVNVRFFEELIEEAAFGENHNVFLIDREKEVFIYEKDEIHVGRDIGELKEQLALMTQDRSYVKIGDSYLIYSVLPEADWIVVDEVPAAVIESSYEKIQRNTLLILGLGTLLIAFMYIVYAQMTSKPITRLKKAMMRIQEGALDTRVDIRTNDEMGTLAEGLNEMAEKLKSHISRVYVAEINQRDARLEALKTQIQPHYLYNTLDVIRMSAITNDDLTTADMLDSLSAQLRYLIGTTRDVVTLGEEVESIRNYFKLVKVRNENRFELEVNVPEELLDMEVPHLILQPVVENAVKHGLRPKAGEGRVAIYGKRENRVLEITVMDSGSGMSAEVLEKLRTSLEEPEPGKRSGHNWESIGVKNVNNRIRLIYGEEYGLSIDSFEEIGTIVKYRLPIRMGDEADV